jgi:hypothetical protein
MKLNRESATLMGKTINENLAYATGTEIYFKMKLSIFINNYQRRVRMSVTCHQKSHV